MKVFAIIVIIVGVIMLAVNTINFKTEEKVVDLGPLEINKEKNHTVNWPAYIGGAVLAAGVVILVVSNKKTA